MSEPTPAWFTEDLEAGDDSPAVLIIQRKLGAHLTGVMDQQTMARIRGFQKRHGLEETGTMTKKTAKKVGDKASKGTPPAWFKGELKEGCSCPAVADLRTALRQPNLPVYFDHDLGAAVRRFQSSVGLKATGVVDEDTAIAMGDRTA